jgi:hypothetical protein
MNKAIIVGFIILFISLLFISEVNAPRHSPYNRYTLTDYNCLHIALETQEWYRFNGIDTTVMVGFNDKDGHAWLVNDETGRVIVGDFKLERYPEVMTFEQWDEMYDVSELCKRR